MKDRVHALFIVGVACLMPHPLFSHGRLWEPPGRSTAWRRGFNSPRYYDDHAQNCGGFGRQVRNGYNCGVCGDPTDTPRPRPNEVGGRYANATWRPLVAHYQQGQTDTFIIEMTANHKGWVQFKLCPTNDFGTEATQHCLDRHRVRLVEESRNFMINKTHTDEYKFKVPLKNGKFGVKVIIPDFTCDLCVLQWQYHTGNSWGCYSTGTNKCGIGKGNQEEFYACADVKIWSLGTAANTTPRPVATTTTMTTTKTKVNYKTKATKNKEVGRCRSVGAYKDVQWTTNWCRANCPRCCPIFICSRECRWSSWFRRSV